MISDNRNMAVDILKGIGILLMMWCHLVQTQNQFVYSSFTITGYPLALFRIAIAIVLASVVTHIPILKQVYR